RKAVAMFHKTNVSVLGIVENMSFFLCPDSGKKFAIFGEGGGEREAARLQVPLLGKIPLEVLVREGGDMGRPIVRFVPDSPAGSILIQIAKKIREILPALALKSL